MVHVHGGSGAGATMAPEGKDNIKGEACLGCKRNSLLPLRHLAKINYPFMFSGEWCNSIRHETYPALWQGSPSAAR